MKLRIQGVVAIVGGLAGAIISYGEAGRQLRFCWLEHGISCLPHFPAAYFATVAAVSFLINYFIVWYGLEVAAGKFVRRHTTASHGYTTHHVH